MSKALELARVGIFDSGVGGLTVAAALRRRLPTVPIHYLADGAYFPYGGRLESVVEARGLVLTQRLIDAGCNLVVVACNTATSAALPQLRSSFSVPFVGTEPALKPALENTQSGRILVMVTPGTAKGARLAALKARLGTPEQVTIAPMNGLATMVEAGELSGPGIESLLRAALGRAADADHLVLGCTHYGFVRDLIQSLAGPDVEVVDAADPVARQAVRLLKENNLTVPRQEAPPIRAETTGNTPAFREIVQRLTAGGARLPAIEVLGV